MSFNTFVTLKTRWIRKSLRKHESCIGRFVYITVMSEVGTSTLWLYRWSLIYVLRLSCLTIGEYRIRPHYGDVWDYLTSLYRPWLKVRRITPYHIGYYFCCCVLGKAINLAWMCLVTKSVFRTNDVTKKGIPSHFQMWSWELIDWITEW